MKSKFKKVVVAVIGLVIMGGVYAGIISLCNRYLRENGLLNPMTKMGLMAILVIGLYLIYRWFCNRLDSVPPNK